MHRLAYRAATRLAHYLPLPTGKLATSVAGRRGARDRWLAWARRDERAHGRAPVPSGRAPTIWVHAASVGEALTAMPVIARLRTAIGGLCVVLSHSSPSLEPWRLPGIDHVDYVPLDVPDHVGPVLDALDPTLLLFSRGDLWPELVSAAAARGVPVAVTGGTVRAASRRLRWPALPALRRMHERVAYVGAVSNADADRWGALGVPRDGVRVTGDPRHDHVLERSPDLRPARSLSSWAAGRPVLVAGSIEREDESPLVDALARLSHREPVRAVLVPHEPTTLAIGRLTARLGAAAIDWDVWEGPGSHRPAAPVVVVAAGGILYGLYPLAHVAFVGGGFGRRGLHAIAEPAAFGVPIAFGPRWQASPDAEAMIAAGGAAVARDRTGGDLAAVLEGWFRNPTQRRRAGMATRATLAPGAASIDAAALVDHFRQNLSRNAPAIFRESSQSL